MYRDAKCLNDKRVMTWTLTVEQRTLIESFHTVPDVHALFTRHRIKQIGRSNGLYLEEVVRQFYESHVETLHSSLDRWYNLAKQEQLDDLRVRGRKVYISLPTIFRFLYDTDKDSTRELLTPEFDYQYKLIEEGHFEHNLGLRDTTKR